MTTTTTAVASVRAWWYAVAPLEKVLREVQVIAALIKGYRGVSCVWCGEAFAVSTSVMRLEDKLESEDANLPRSFIARCKVCRCENVYSTAAIETFEGEPKKASSKKSRAVSA
jgi:hypothetical protein